MGWLKRLFGGNEEEAKSVLSEQENTMLMYGPPPALENRLVLYGTNGQHKYQTFFDKKARYVIGRAPECDICIKQSEVISSQHVEIVYAETDWIIRCIGRNSIKLGGRKILSGEEKYFSRVTPELLELPSGDCFVLQASY